MNVDNQTCGLLPFPDDPPCTDCRKGTVENAEAHLTSHTDARRPEDIYKPWVLPWRHVRLGIALLDHAGAHTELYAAYVSDIGHLTGGLIPLGGRILFEVSWTPRAQQTSCVPATLAAHWQYDSLWLRAGSIS